MYGECTVNVRWMYGECTVNVREPTLVLFSHSKPLQRDTRPCIHAQRTPPPDFKVGGSWPRWSSPAGTQADHSILKSGGGVVEYGYTVENTDKHAENMYAPTAAPDVPMCGVAIRGVPGLLLSLYSDSSKLVRP
jgi:hypothetical protein